MKRALLVVVAIAASACSSSNVEPRNLPTALPSTSSTTPSTSVNPSASTTSTTGAPPTAPTTIPPPTGAISLTFSVVTRATEPIALVARSGTDKTYVAERGGTVRILNDGNLSAPILDISRDTTAGGERGLLGIAFSPDGTKLYVSYTNRSGDSRIDEFEANGDSIDTGSRRNVLGLAQPFANHNGGHIVFGPDGYLYIGFGDGGSQGDPRNNGQNYDAMLGSILRIDPKPSGNKAYSIPPDNPFVNGGGLPEIWLKGVRNPWRFSFDSRTGDLWIGDVGGTQREEVDFLPAPERGRGANLQWPLQEGTLRLKGAAPADSVAPVFEYDHNDQGGCSITGGVVYRGQRFPSLQGTYLMGDYCTGLIWALVPNRDGGVVRRQLSMSPARIGDLSSFGTDSKGEMYAMSLKGQIFAITVQ